MSKIIRVVLDLEFHEDVTLITQEDIFEALEDGEREYTKIIKFEEIKNE